MRKLLMIWSFLKLLLPEAVVALIYVGRRDVAAGRKIDAKAQAVSDLVTLVRDPEVMPSVDESRRQLATMAEKLERRDMSGLTVRDTELPGADGARRARVYQPESMNDASGAVPTLLFFHGGGWVQGSIETHDGMCARLARDGHVRVLSYDYRLAPEHPFPAGLDDVIACYRALTAGQTDFAVSQDSLVVGGDSAGANLTASLMHVIAAEGLPMPKAQVLIYPAVDARMQSVSMRDLAHQPLLPVTRINWFLDLYIPEGVDRLGPRVSPLLADRFQGQPDALIVVAGHDPLWDDGHAYANELEKAGTPVTLLEYPGQIHAFMSLTKVIPQGNHALDETAAWVRNAIH